ncbi:hypothetical protein TWF718_002149 [Orbilia javanica]|uniref:Uncharacterized protein n=1 Tax=Orbilia javanica TaxID=47235 RepID=A0AAN8MJM9_9PEZI
MYLSSRLNLLVVALIALVSFCTARTTITIQSCATRYCANPTEVLRTTKTIHKTTRYTKVRWRTSTKYKTTTTTTSTRFATTTKYSTSTLKTVTIITGTSTRTQTLPHWFFATEPYTVTWLRTSIYTPTYTVPTPSGFLALDNDPDNAASPDYTALPSAVVDADKRNVKIDIEPRDPANKYASAVTCTKTLLTKTGTSDLWKTTTKTSSTSTKVVYKTLTITRSSTKTVTAKDAKTTRVLFTTYTSIYGTSTETIWTMLPTTLFTTTVLTSEATATVYAACANANVAPDHIIYHRHAAVNYGPDPDEKVVEIVAPGGPETCCALCQTYSGPGQCMGSIYNFLGAEIPEEDCPDAWSGGVFLGWEFCPYDPDNDMKCQLIISQEEESCRTRTFEFIPAVFGKTRDKHLSNGPACARFKYKAPAAQVP